MTSPSDSRSSKDKLSLLEWVLERFENCVRIAKTKEAPADRDGWFEDAAYFREILVILNAQSSNEPPAALDAWKVAPGDQRCVFPGDTAKPINCMSKGRAALVVAAVNAYRASPPPVLARPLGEWHEDMGDVVWWKFPMDEPAYIGSPLAEDWPGYHTHWTPHPPVPPTWTDKQIDALHASAEQLGSALTKAGE